jgi:hypothetical protein
LGLPETTGSPTLFALHACVRGTFGRYGCAEPTLCKQRVHLQRLAERILLESPKLTLVLFVTRQADQTIVPDPLRRIKHTHRWATTRV